MASKKKPTAEISPEDQQLKDIRLKLSKGLDGDKHNRDSFVAAMRFINLEQWPEEIKKKRKKLPCLVIDRINPAISQVLGDQRQNRPSIKIRPAGMGSKPEIAELREGLIRNIWAISRADIALDTASESQVQGGWGYIRVYTEYAINSVDEQDIKIGAIRNTLSVIFDPIAQEWDRMDGGWFFVVDKISKDAYKAKYGEDKGITGIDVGDDQLSMWRGEDDITVAEYFWKEEVEETLYLVEQVDSQGEKTSLVVGEDKKNELMEGVQTLYIFRDEQGNKAVLPQQQADMLRASNPGVNLVETVESPRIVKQRTMQVPKIYRVLTDGYRILEEKQEWPSQYWPVIPVDGKEIFIEGKIYRRGMVKNAMDAQRMYNYSVSSQATNIALANKIPYILTPEMVEGHEGQWNRAHEEPFPYLLVNQAALKEAGGWPQRQLPPQASSAYTEMAMQSAEDVRITTEVHQAALGIPSNETSGIAINARKVESDVANSIYNDNLVRAVHRAGEIINELIPVIYDTERVVTIMQADDTTQEVKVNEVAPVGANGLINETLNDLTVGKYKVAVDVGPSYTTQRMEAADSMLKFLQTLPDVGAVLSDEIFRNLDFPGAQKMKDRLMAAMVMSGKAAMFTQEEIEYITRKFPQLQRFITPPEPQPDPNLVRAQTEAQKLQAEMQMKMDLHELEKQKMIAEIEKTKADGIKSIALAEAAEAGTQIKTYEQILNGLGMQLANAPGNGNGRSQKKKSGGGPSAAQNPIEGRAEGGSVSGGVPYLVGEKGPEVVIPGGDMGPWGSFPIEKPKNWQEKRYNELEVYDSPDHWVYIKHPTHSDWYQKGMIQSFAQAAKKYGIDPVDYVALGISESGLGNQHPSNPSRIDYATHGDELGKYPEEMGSTDRSIDYGAKYLSDQFSQYKDRLSALQAYSGTGKTIYGGKPGRYFGKDVSQINAWRDKPQAKRIVDIANRIKKNPEIMELIDSATKYPVVELPEDIEAVRGNPPVNMQANIPQRASGGPVGAGSPYIVGENGPEVIVPSQDGMVIPNVRAWKPTTMPPEQEKQFQKDIKSTGWYQEFVQKYGEAPDLNDPNYDYRGAWRAGMLPTERNPQDKMYHWSDRTPSGQWLKSPNHPTAWANPFIEQFGINPDELPPDDPRVVAFSRAWHEKYPPRY